MKERFNLRDFNTFGIAAICDKFIRIESLKEAQSFFSKENKGPLLILGGGSNILLRNDFHGLVVLNDIRGIEIIEENDDEVLIKANAGEEWHSFVLYCIEREFAGIENLSLIPGKVGASPMQNIGAYGVEVKEVIEEVEAVSIKGGNLRKFTNEECEFGYRTSVFKTSLKGKYFITSVSFRLKKKASFKTSYGAIQDELMQMGINEENLTIKAISDAVISIRRSKLPNPAEIGNSGSFFKNPVVDSAFHQELKKEFKNIPAYDVGDGQFKLAAGWLIEQAGWKGFREGDYGVHDKQALVLVNHGNSTGEEIFQLSKKIIQSVKEKFGVTLEREVNIVGGE